MIKEFNFRITPERIHDHGHLERLVMSHMTHGKLNHVEILKKSIDARKRDIVYQLKVAAYIDEEFIPPGHYYTPQSVSGSEEVCIIGAGPAGYFAALKLIELGLKPVIFERGKDVRSRRRDLVRIHRDHIVNENSNYCFGEGGAGTYSDGKLYTRSKKRGDVQKVLEWFVHFGAERGILTEAHPHIGTNRLPAIIAAMRDAILSAGGEIHFDARVTDLKTDDVKILGIEWNGKEHRKFDRVILATGHSARDIFYLLDQKKIRLEAKPFALGVRIEHPQSLIDQIQYHGRCSDEFLPPASYSLVGQEAGRGVYSFCMCPGGIIAPCATLPGEVVTNAWSPSKRNNPYANSGMVVEILPEDLGAFGDIKDPLICLKFQKNIEQLCCAAAGGSQKVPAQRLLDFLDGKVSGDLPVTSYQPGLTSVDLNRVLPDFITRRLRAALKAFGGKMKGFLTNEAVLHAPESRTSSPIRIPRITETLEHPEIRGLYPCGEGAGYAGGIVSAAIDGMNIVQSIYATSRK